MSTPVTRPAPDFTATAGLADDSLDEGFTLSSLRGMNVIPLLHPLDQ